MRRIRQFFVETSIEPGHGSHSRLGNIFTRMVEALSCPGKMTITHAVDDLIGLAGGLLTRLVDHTSRSFCDFATGGYKFETSVVQCFAEW